MVSSIFVKPEKTKSFVAPDDKRRIADTFLTWLTYSEIATFIFRRSYTVEVFWRSVIFEEYFILRLTSQSIWGEHSVVTKM